MPKRKKPSATAVNILRKSKGATKKPLGKPKKKSYKNA